MENRGLSGCCCLVTRPDPVADELVSLLESHGATTEKWPCLRIQPMAIQGEAVALIQQNPQANWIFISQNAVQSYFKFPQQVQWVNNARLLFAIGQGTALALSEQSTQPVIYPPESSSEHFLSMPTLANIEGEVFFIVRGGAGRELLKETLTARGATVHYIDCYSRLPPSAEVTHCIERELVKGAHYNFILFTSFESLSNAWKALNNPTLLLRSAITVTNPRMKLWATEKGFANIIMLKSMSNDDVVQCLLEYIKGKTDD